MRVRVPIEKHSTADEHQKKMMKLYRKFNLQQKKLHNNINDKNGNEEDKNETEESREVDLSDLEILGVSKSSHPCVNEVLIEKQACGMRNKPCEYEIYGIPRKLKHLKIIQSNHIIFHIHIVPKHFVCLNRNQELAEILQRIDGITISFQKNVTFSHIQVAMATKTTSKHKNSVNKHAAVRFSRYVV